MRALTLALALLAATFGAAAGGLGPDDAHDPMKPSSTPPTQKITTFLWFDTEAEEAVRLYTSLFADSKVLADRRWGPDGPVPEGELMSARFRLAGQEFMALNGGPLHRFSEATSLFVRCESQEEVDALWTALTADGGEPGRCGWLKDKFGLSWQIVPRRMEELLMSQEPGVAQRVAAAMMQMGKIDVARLEAAARG